MEILVNGAPLAVDARAGASLGEVMTADVTGAA